jgi:DNA-binding IclR family transcriptional regulator
MPRTGQPASRRIAAVERAAAVLFELAEAGGELGTNELARRLELSASTASRLLATLAGSGLVEHRPQSGRYRLGPGLLRLGNAALAHLDLRGVARPQLTALSARTGETATLSVPGEREAITVDFVQSPASIQSVARIGRPSLAHATATGKVLLAFGRRELPPPPLEAFTARTITDPVRLATEVGRAHEQGFAEAAGEREDDLNAIAAPVFDHRGELTAIVGLQGPASRFDPEAMQGALPALLASARAISRTLGWTASEEHEPEQPCIRRGALPRRKEAP